MDVLTAIIVTILLLPIISMHVKGWKAIAAYNNGICALCGKKWICVHSCPVDGNCYKCGCRILWLGGQAPGSIEKL